MRALHVVGRSCKRTVASILLCGLILFANIAVADDIVWVEAEQFTECGGWTNDAQFIDQMGSPYLLAVGLGAPVEDAVTNVTVRHAGRYRLWARTKDWVPEHHPGRFQIVVGGQAADKCFGASGRKGWQWEDGGVFELSDRVELRLHDLTGYYGRCDAIVLVEDLKWTPPADMAAIAKLREFHGGVSREVKDAGEFDVVVVGGGLAGCTAAVAAARMGADTVLIQNRPILGGNASTEILVPPVGVWPHMKQDSLDPRETGLIEEYRTAGNQRVSEGVLYSERLMRFVRGEPNVALHLNTHATGVRMCPEAPEKVDSVQAVNVVTGERMSFGGQVFIDCTGDAVIGVAAGAEYRHGKEPRSMYNEPWAPTEASRHTMGNSLKYVSVKTDSLHPFTALPWAMEFPTCEEFGSGRHPILGGDIGWQWKLELGGTRDTYADAEEIRDDLLRLIYGLWDHVKNHCPPQEEAAAHHRLAWVGHVAGKRENRRLVGDYVLTENDIRNQTLFPDRVAYGGWCLDDHYSDGFFHRGTFGIHMDRPGGLDACQGWLYSIPYRSHYSKNVNNLLMAGRDISASHMALSDTRVMLTCAVIGQAAGAAAAMCAVHDTTPRGVYEEHIGQLQQQLLKDGAHIIDLANDDPRDLARQATATASSEQTRQDGHTMAASNAINGYARAAGDKTNAWCPAPDGPEPHWLELRWNQPVSFNMVHVTFATKAHVPESFHVETRQGERWERVTGRTDVRHRRHVLGFEQTAASALRVVFADKCTVSEIRVYDEPQRLVDTANRAAANMAARDETPALIWMIDVDPKKLPGIVIDAGEAKQTGRWVNSTYARPYVLDGYLHDGDDGKGEKSIVFTPNLPGSGTYEVRIAYVPFSNRATNTPVTITTPQGSKAVLVNQRQTPKIDNLFHTLGEFQLPAGRKTNIIIENKDTDGYVVVDAIQLLPK